jgi:hypothetical protein
MTAYCFSFDGNVLWHSSQSFFDTQVDDCFLIFCADHNFLVIVGG